jgi:hypothetical protein
VVKAESHESKGLDGRVNIWRARCSPVGSLSLSTMLRAFETLIESKSKAPCFQWPIPRAGCLCERSGLTRDELRTLILPGAHNEFKPPVRASRLGKRSIYYFIDSLLGYLDAQTRKYRADAMKRGTARQKERVHCVYIAPHVCEARFKLGKSKDPLTRLRRIVDSGHNLQRANIIVLLVANEADAFCLETSLRKAHFMTKARLPPLNYGDGKTEWHHLDALPRLTEFIEKNRDLFGIITIRKIDDLAVTVSRSKPAAVPKPSKDAGPCVRRIVEKFTLIENREQTTYAVMEYGGGQRRRLLARDFNTVEAAQAEYPDAEVAW